MNKQALKYIREAIGSWLCKRQYQAEHKTFNAIPYSMVQGEYILYFEKSIHGFLCNGVRIPIDLRENAFPTTTLSNDITSHNPNADVLRLEKHLSDFDKKFYQIVNGKLNGCIETLTKSDPSFFQEG